LLNDLKDIYQRAAKLVQIPEWTLEKDVAPRERAR